MKAKKIVITIFALIVLLLASAILIPVFFKNEVISKTKTAINEQVNATVEFSDLNISFFRSFPKVQLEIENLSITGKDQFQGDTLLSVASIATDISLSDLFKLKSKGLQISSLSVNQAQINLLSTNDGFSNWDITLPVEKEDIETEPEETSNFSVALNDIDVNDLSLNFIDEASTAIIRLKNSNLNASGTVKGTVTRFDFNAEIAEFVLEYDSVEYIGNTVLKVESELEADFEKMNFIFGKSILFLNDLPLDVSGQFGMPSDSMYFDLAFKQAGSDFKSLLALVPKDYQSYLEQITTNGEAGFDGYVKGWFYEDNYPEFGSHLFVKNANLQYEGLSEKIENINLETTISKPQGDLNLMEVNIEKAQAQIRENPVMLNLKLSELIVDPKFDGTFNGKINFNNLSNAIPMDSIELKGMLDGELAIKGSMSAIEAKDFNKVTSSGVFNFSNFSVLTPQITKPFAVQSGSVKVTTPAIVFESFSGNIGQSDFQLNGKLNNYLPYALKGEELKGEFRLNSKLMNLNELSALMVDEEPTETTEEEMLAFHVPGKLDLSFRSTITRALFDKMDIRNINGLIRIKDEKLSLQQLDMDMLRGSLTVDGAYQNNKANQPEFDFNMNVKSFDIPAAYQSLSMMRRYMPIAARSQGNISSMIKFKGQMNEKLEIISSTLDGNGFFNTQNLQILDSPTFNQIRGVIKKEKLKNVRVDDFTANFNIENGNLLLKPFKTKIANQETTIHGSLSAESILNMDMDFKLNREDLDSEINNALGFLPGSDNIKIIDATVKLKGSLKNPDVSLDLSKARKQIQEEVTKSGKEEIEKKVKKLGDELKKLFR